MTDSRMAQISRETAETSVQVRLELDQAAPALLDTGIPFLDHMLAQLAKHAAMTLEVQARGDLEIDAHHTVEDIGIALGQALQQAVGDKKGMFRYGHFYAPLDEALTRVVVDFSGRPGLYYGLSFSRARIGDFDVDLLHEFFQGLVNHAGMTLHVDGIRGDNAHHVAESAFKAFARALRMAVSVDLSSPSSIPSTKGML